MVVHEKSYKGRGIASFVHRRRLNNLFKIFDGIDLKESGKFADFGCSNGFIISLLKEKTFADRDYEFYGFDHSDRLLGLAKERDLEGTSFHYFDLNEVNKEWENAFDVVTCLETFEHTGDYRNAFHNLYVSCKINGIIIISMPNEKGLQGLLKYFGRDLIRRNRYSDFFEGKSRIKYATHLLLNKRIDVFREPEASGWGPHLGFDWKMVRKHLEESYIQPKKLECLDRRGSFANFNFFFVLRKIG